MKFLPIVIVVLGCFLTFFTAPADAAKLNNTLVRLDRLTPQTALSGLICATPSAADSGTEGRIAVTFPLDFSLSTLSTNWTTETTNLPAGSTPWPGISNTAQTVSGTTVTFASTNLTSETADYCFRFTGIDSATGATGSKQATIVTQTAGGTEIDSNTIGMTITDDRIRVTGKIAARPQDYSVQLTKVSGGDTFAQDAEITYELTYESYLAYAAPVTLEAGWTQATGGIELLAYVNGSATKAYANTVPVIDTENRRITWTIPTLPAGASGSVRFALKTTDRYQGLKTLDFTVNGRLLSEDTATPYSSITKQYLYVIPTPDPNRPTATPGITITPTPLPRAFALESLQLRRITATEVDLFLRSSEPSTVLIRYGTSPGNLSEQLVSLNPAINQTVTLGNLTPNTRYYFTVTLTNQRRMRLLSDTYTFTTAKVSRLPAISRDSLIITSGNTVIFTPDYRQYTGGKNVIIVPAGKQFELQFGLTEEHTIRSLNLHIRSQSGESIDMAPMFELKPDIYTSRLPGKTIPGMYEILAELRDYNGNMIEQGVSDLKVSRPFRIISQRTGKPIEKAKITLERYNEKTRVYEPISQNFLAITNPAYSNRDGIVDVVLPVGKYRAIVEEFTKVNQTVEFTLGIHPDEDYPTVALDDAPFSLMNSMRYLLSAFSDTFSLVTGVGLYLFGSERFLHILGFLAAITFTLLSVIALSEKVKIKPHKLFPYFRSLLQVHRAEEKTHRYRGRVTNGETGSPLVGVDLFVTDPETGKTRFHTKTNTTGRFQIMLPPKANYTLRLEKVNYHASEFPLRLFVEDEEQQFTLLNHQAGNYTQQRILKLLRELLGVSFEACLIIAVILSVVMTFTLGLMPVLPLLTVALFNMIFWTLHTLHLHEGE